MANFTQGSLFIEEYFFGFQTLWADYCEIVYPNVPTVAVTPHPDEVHSTCNCKDAYVHQVPF